MRNFSRILMPSSFSRRALSVPLSKCRLRIKYFPSMAWGSSCMTADSRCRRTSRSQSLISCFHSCRRSIPFTSFRDTVIRSRSGTGQVLPIRRNDVCPGGLGTRMRKVQHIFVSYIMPKKCFRPGAFLLISFPVLHGFRTPPQRSCPPTKINKPTPSKCRGEGIVYPALCRLEFQRHVLYNITTRKETGGNQTWHFLSTAR